MMPTCQKPGCGKLEYRHPKKTAMNPLKVTPGQPDHEFVPPKKKREQ